MEIKICENCKNSYVDTKHDKKRKNCSYKCARKKHGKSRTRIYHIWEGMIQRCTNSNNNSYKNYGGRGIDICDEWLDFANFYRDMKDTYKSNLTIDRIDNNAGYNKKNCRWVCYNIQAYNRRKRKVNCTSKYTGVSWRKDRSKWIAKIWVKGKLQYLGSFNTEYDAHLAYEYRRHQLITQLSGLE